MIQPVIDPQQVDVGTNPNQIVQLDSLGRLPAVDGSQLLSLPGGSSTIVLNSPVDKGLVNSTGIWTTVTDTVLSSNNATAAIVKIEIDITSDDFESYVDYHFRKTGSGINEGSPIGSSSITRFGRAYAASANVGNTSFHGMDVAFGVIALGAEGSPIGSPPVLFGFDYLGIVTKPVAAVVSITATLQIVGYVK